MSDFVEMEVEVIEELEDEVACLKGQIKTLRDFLMTNFAGELGLVKDPHWDDVHFEDVIEQAVRLLTELKERRRQVEALRAERQAMSTECLEEARQLIRFVNHLNKGEPDGRFR